MLRFMGIALAALLAVGGLAFAAGDEEAAASAYQLNPPGTYPVVDEKVTITAIAYYSSSTSSGTPGDAAFATYLEDLTNVQVDFVEMIESNGAQEKFNLILASGDLPDVLIPHGSITAQQVFLHGSNGTFLPLNDLIEERMPSLKQRLSECAVDQGAADHARRQHLRIPGRRGELLSLPVLGQAVGVPAVGGESWG